MSIWTRLIDYFIFLVKSLGISLNLIMELIPFTITFVLLRDSKDELATSTLALTMSCFVYFFGYLMSFQEAISIRCTPFFSNNAKKLFSQEFYSIFIINLLFLAFSIILVLCSKQLLLALNIEDDLVIKINLLLLQTLAAKVIENISNIMKGLLASQNNFMDFYIINLISIFSFSIAVIAFVKWYDMGLKGFAIALTIKIVFEFIALIILVSKRIERSYLRLPNWKQIKSEFTSTLTFVLVLIIGSYFELICYFFSYVILALERNSNYITAFSLHMDIQMYIYYIQVGYVSYIRTQLLIEVGNRDKQAFISQNKKYFVYSFITSIFIIVAWLLCFEIITSMYVKNRGISELVNILLFMNTFIILIEFFSLTFSSYLKIIKHERKQFIITIAFLCPSIVLLQYLFVKVISLDVVGCKLGAIISLFLFAILLTITYIYLETSFLEQLEHLNLEENENQLEISQLEILNLNEDSK